MKLKTRLSLIFGTVVLVIVATIGIVTYNKNVEMGTADAKKTMQISADSASKCLRDIVENSEQISKAFKDISIDTKEQADKSSHIKLEISNISEVVQVNSATAEETAAATEELSEQAKNLTQLISRFRV